MISGKRYTIWSTGDPLPLTDLHFRKLVMCPNWL
jgi:hypothetical protein